MEATSIQRKKLWNDLHFNAVGLIYFIMINDHTFLDKEHLRTLVDEADKAHPWSSFFKDTDPSATRIVEIGNAKMHNPSQWKGREYVISIQERDLLKPDQFYAYSRYLDCLAEQLAARDVVDVHTAKVQMKITGCIAEYVTPFAQKYFERMLGKMSV